MSPMRLRAALLCASLLFAASPSHANGRFPLSQRLFQDQGNPDHLFVSATFGLLLSQDHGQNWYHVCEGALTPELLESDVLFELMPDGAMLASLVRPLRVSTDCGCTWQPVLGDAMDQSITDISRRKLGARARADLGTSTRFPNRALDRLRSHLRQGERASTAPAGLHARRGALESDARVRLGRPQPRRGCGHR